MTRTGLLCKHRFPIPGIKFVNRVLIRLLFKHTIPLLVLLLCAGIAAALLNMANLSSSLIEKQALESAKTYVEVLQNARSLYSNEVVSKVVQHDDMAVSHIYKNLTQADLAHTIPIPATFLIDLGEQISHDNSGVKVRLYSDYPFPNRSNGGPNDAFERDALLRLRQNPDSEISRIESSQGKRTFRFARADIMQQSCVECHNTHPESPRKDWQVDDVRGVLAITIPLDLFVGETYMWLHGTFALLAGLSGLCIVGIALVIGRLRQTSEELELRVHERTADLKWANQQLAEAQEKSEGLLLNVLPETIAHRLKEGDSTISDGFAEVTILFADLVNFTALSAQMSPTQLVILLNQIFSAFDQLTEQYGLEKIKTIGDAYMVAGGLPTPRPDHAEAIAEMALAMRQEINRLSQTLKQSLDIRIGINSGPVVAGVIGTKKFIYDLWGDTVNIASRMESQGIAGGIQIAPATYTHLQGKYLIEHRGSIEVKGKGEMETYWLMEKWEKEGARGLE
ncbi:MAG: adenylate/guanylate cyclase domain-containing protein [Leptolyngbyaceae cyanobacterium MO_188.B28]|nr:adenylate/guanylate cyclase domain-containing protein [Leptolyngbyaceae cyanobacterium MO_188.B28]